MVLEFDTAKEVFIPTSTSELLIQSAQTCITAPGRLLDLGCGIGVCGIVLAKSGVCHTPVYCSDLSEKAAALASHNARIHDVEVVVRVGSLFAPWIGERFDVIVDDVSAVCESIARLSRWFPEGVDCQAGPDGTALVLQILNAAPQHLNPGGMLLFPVLSLSRADRVLDAARAVFEEVSCVAERSWFLPQELLDHLDVVQALQQQGLVHLEYKFGAWLWSTAIYKASRPKA